MTAVFRWSALPPATLEAVGELLELEDPVNDLVTWYGRAPTTAFVQDTWVVLRETWLAEDVTSRRRIIDALVASGLAPPVSGRSTSAELSTIAAAHHGSELRQIVASVLQEAAMASEASSPASAAPAASRQPPPPSSSAPPAAHRTAGGPAAGLNPLLAQVLETMSVDAEWMAPTQGGVSWWPHQLRQDLVTDAPRQVTNDEGDSTVITPLRVFTAVARGVVPSAQVDDVIARSNRLAAMEALVLDPQSGRLFLSSSFYTHPEIPWIEQWTSMAAALQASRAEALSNVSSLPAGIPDLSPHPTSGWRPAPDEMVAIATAFVADALDGATSSIGVDHLAAAGKLFPPALAPRLEDAVLLVRVPWSVERRWRLARRKEPAAPTIAVDADAAHPSLGVGLGVSIVVPNRRGLPAAVANRLNALEALNDTDFHLMGAWTAAGPNLVFTSFFPKLLFDGLSDRGRVNTVVNLVAVMLARGRWVMGQL